MRLSYASSPFSIRHLAGAKGFVRLEALFLTLFLATLSLWPGLSHAVPVGTEINNTANVSYDMGTAHYNINSNTHQFLVESLAPAGATLTLTGNNTSTLYPGTTVTLGVNIENTGGTNLNNGFLFIDTPKNTQLTLTGGTATLVSKTTGSTKITHKYSVGNVLPGNNLTYQAQLSLALGPVPSSKILGIRYVSDGNKLIDQNINLNISARSHGTLQLLQYSTDDDAVPTLIKPTEFKDSNGNYNAIPDAELDQLPGVMVSDGPVALKETTKFSHKQIIFIKVEDYDQNVDHTSEETVEIDLDITKDGEAEHLKLHETSKNSGIFTGYIMLAVKAANSNDGTLDVHPDTEVDFNYMDQIDNSDTNLQIVLVDPFGVVFDSATGELLNGYTVHLINSDTGQPATVYGDDGVSSYPATLVTGGSVTDAGGTIYHFSDGAYRFPFAPVGNYELVVVPPDTDLYRWPSDQPTELINELPNAPYAITLGSRGEKFPLIPGPPLHIDIPVDAVDSQMYIQRSANKDKVAPGDFVQYRVTIENVANVTIHDVELTDTLPHGFRLEEKSLLINSLPAATPVISAKGNEITFSLGNMDSGDIYTVEYVAAVGAVSRRSTSSSSYAIANGGAATSNVAEHDIQIIDELMRSRALLMGQVLIEPRDGDENDSPKGLAGARIYMEDGRYAVTDERGMYHFEDVHPGSHVVQLDLDTIPEQYEVVLSEDNSRFAGRAWSQFVDVQGGTLWRTDFHIANKPAPEGNVSIQISNKGQLNNGDIPFLIEVNSETVNIENMRLNVLIPEGVTYMTGTSTLDGVRIDDPSINDNMLTYKLGNTTDHKGRLLLGFVVSKPSPVNEQLITKASLIFNTPAKRNQRAPLAEHVIMIDKNEMERLAQDKAVLNIKFKKSDDQISAEDRMAIHRFATNLKDLQGINVHVVGHSDNLPVKWIGTRERFGDNYMLSGHRALVVANELRDMLKLPPSQITVEGRGPDEPIADNSTDAGRAANRRVEIYVYRKQKQTTTAPIGASSGSRQQAKTRGKDPAAVANKEKPAANSDKSTPVLYDAEWLKNKNSSLEWLQPQADELPQQTSTPITIKHHKDHKVEVTLNGRTVQRANFEGSYRNERDAMLSLWKGVDLKIGDNTLEATIRDQQGNLVEKIKRTVHVSGAVMNAELVKEKSTLIADGRTPPVIAIRVTDEDGYPLREGTTGQFSVKPPYQVAKNSDFNLELMAGSTIQTLHSFDVGNDGIAQITLEPSNKTGDIEIELTTADNEKQTIKARMKAEKRDWILVGLVEGTSAYDTVSGNKEALGAATKQDHLYQDGRIAFFAKGQVLGKWLLTMGYDSDKERVRGEDPNLFQSIDPGSYYTIYGDTSNNGNDAASSEKLYLLIERDEFYLLFGDYATGFNQTELATYDRTLTGIKSEYEGDDLYVAVFTSQTNQSFVKDEFRGESRSGPYQLSRTNIAMNSEKVVLETRNRFRSEEIVETTELSRHSDYDIDYVDGTITFRKPVYSIDENLNHIFIVIKYEAYDDSDEQATYGGRAKVKINDKLSVGVTHVNEGRTGGEAKLGGVDVDYQLTEKTNLHMEAARTKDNNIIGADGKGDAYLAELEHNTNKSSSSAYIRETDTGFGLGQTNGSEDSSRKVGAETRVKVTDKINIQAQAYRQEQTATQATRDLAEANAALNLDIATLRMGVRTAIDEQGNGDKHKSEQITAGVSKGFFKDKLVARADHEENINDDNSIDFPDRTTMGVDFRLNDKATLFAEQELTDGNIRDTRSTLLGIKSTPWSGGTLYTGVTNTLNESGEATSANIAGTQTWQLTDAWSLDIGAEQSKLLSQTTGTQLNANVPFASGASEDFTASSLALTYMAGDWMWTGRVESRNGVTQDLRTLASSAQSTPNASISLLGSLTLMESDSSTGEESRSSEIGLGLAYRPIASKWIILDKLELRRDETTGSSFNDDAKRIINMLHANYKTGRWQLSLQYGAKAIREIINLQTYDSYTDLSGFETRYDITSHWDIGLHGNVLRSRELNHYDYNSGLSIGHYLAKNIWISLGYNFTGFRDEDFSRSNYTSEGWFLKFRLKFDQQSVKEGLEWLKK